MNNTNEHIHTQRDLIWTPEACLIPGVSFIGSQLSVTTANLGQFTRQRRSLDTVERKEGLEEGRVNAGEKELRRWTDPGLNEQNTLQRATDSQIMTATRAHTHTQTHL